MILTAEISKMAHQLGLGDKTIEKDYILTWVLNAIAVSPLHEFLAFKRGTAIKKIYVPDYSQKANLLLFTSPALPYPSRFKVP